MKSSGATYGSGQANAPNLNLEKETSVHENLRVCLFVVFKNHFLFLKTKNIKNIFGEIGVFLFFVFPIKNYFSF